MPFGHQTNWQRQALPRPEILSYPLETNVIDSIVLNAAGVSADSSGPYEGRRYLLAGTILSKRQDNQYERYTAASAASAVQTVTITGSPTGGTFTLTFNGQTTSALAYNAAASAVDTALEALSNVGAGQVAVTGSNGGPYTVTFGGTLANTDVAAITGSGAGLTGGTNPGVSVAQTAEGGSAQTVAGILFDTVEFADNSDVSDEPVAMVRRNVSFNKTKIVDFVTYQSALTSALTTCEFV